MVDDYTVVFNWGLAIGVLFFLASSCYQVILLSTSMNDEKSKIRRVYMWVTACMVLSSFFYGLMTIADNITMARIYWAFGFISGFLFYPRLLIFICDILRINNKISKYILNAVFYGAVVLALAGVFSDGVAITPTAYGNRISYPNNWLFTVMFLCAFVLAGTAMLAFLVWRNKSELQGHRRQIMWMLLLTSLAAPIVFITDFITPIYTDIPALPLALFALIPASIRVYILIRKYKTFGVSVQNVAAYTFTSVTVPTLVLDHDNIIRLENKAGLEFVGGSAIGKSISDFVLTDADTKDNENYVRAFTSKLVQVKTRRGIRTCDMALTVEYDKFGDAICKVVVLMDVTDIHALNEQIRGASERMMLMLDTSPICTQIWSRQLETIDCNQAGVNLYGFKDKQEYKDRFLECCSPEYQPDGQRSDVKAVALVNKAFEEGRSDFLWMHQKPDGTPIPADISLVRAKYGDQDVVLGYTRDMREHNQMMNDIEAQSNLMQASNQAAAFLLDSDYESFDRHLHQAMEIIAKAAEIDRVHIWKNSVVNDVLCCSQIYDYPSGARAHYGIEGLTHVPYDQIAIGLKEMLSTGKSMNTMARDTAPELQEALAHNRVQSILVVPVFIRDQFWGYAGFDDCTRERLFTDTEEAILRSTSLLIVNALLRNETLHNLRDTSSELLQRDNLLQAVNQVATLLLSSSEDENIKGPLFESMKLVGRSVDADRIYIWRNELINGELHFACAYSWFSPAGMLKKSVVQGMKFSYKDRPHWERAFSSGECISGSLSQMQNAKQDFQDFEIQSVVMVPLFLDEQLWGFFSVDYCERERDFTEDDIAILRSVSLMMVSAINRYALVEKRTRELALAHDEARAASQAKSDFLANMSHEIRTPMNVIVGLTELLLEDDAPEEIEKEYLQKINSAGMTLTGLINDVLDISKIESGKFDLTPVQYELASLLNDVVTLSVVRIGEKPITFRLEAGWDLPAFLYGDDLRVKQILVNLLSNACKYTREGSVTLRVSCMREGENHIKLSFAVVDTGIGMRPDDMQKLFTDYNQVDTHANRLIEGTGLGLSIAKGLTDLMEGDITVESEYGVGSTFRVNIRQGYIDGPCIGEERIESLRSFRYNYSKRDSDKQFSRPDLSWAKVLVVDDSMTNLDVARGVLGKYKMKVDCVISGQDSIDRVGLAQPVYHAIFMDHMMPGMDGMEAAKRIRALGTEYAKSIPIIALTANAVAGNEQWFLDEGFQAFLSKPISLAKLDVVVRQWIMTGPGPEPVEAGAEIKSSENRTPIHIPGVNAKLGLSLYEGDTEMYADILRSFAENTPAEIDNLRGVTAAELPLYAINIHTLKGVCATIGAKELSDRAKQMEKMAKGGDFNGIAALNEGFIRDAETLVADVRAWLSNN